MYFIKFNYQFINEKMKIVIKSGVDISLANSLVKYISKVSNKNVKKTKDISKKDIIGGFGSLFDISNIKVKDPVIVACTDGVGTKIDLANI